MKILVASNLDASDHALSEMVNALPPPGEPVSVCHVQPSWSTNVVSEAAIIAATESRWRELTLNPNIEVEAVPASGSPHGGVLATAKELDVELIVVSAGADRYAGTLASTAEKIARHASCSVLIARCGDEGPLIVGTDFSKAADLAAGSAKAWAELSGRQLIALHSVYRRSSSLSVFAHLFKSEPADELDEEANTRRARPRMRELFDGECVITTQRPGAALVSLAKERSAQCIVLGATGRTDHDDVKVGAEAMVVAHRASCSVLLCRSGDHPDASPDPVLATDMPALAWGV